MPKWYEKYDKLLNECKKRTRITCIHLWFEETSARMRLNMIELENKKRTRMSAKHCI